ncbi:conserved hypothetical protein [Tenacibaculum sp. 190524A02b]|uniref:Uncharacterized protein n=1 Tax=Tenacibaculum vairaonense TaxID=3137860 RepID=A0ABP1FJ36_9FLAO
MQQITQEQIQAWKKEHGKVFELKAKDKVAYIRKPDFNEVSFATAESINSPLNFPKEILTQCWLGGDEIIKTDVGYIMGISTAIDKIVEAVEFEIKEV